MHWELRARSGAQAVAEMTGRKGRVVRDGRGHGVYELRAKPDSAEMDSLNVREAGALAEQNASWPMDSQCVLLGEVGWRN